MTDDVPLAILSPLLVERLRAEQLAEDVRLWLVSHARTVGEDRTAWASSKAIDAALLAIEYGAGPSLPPERMAQLRAMPIAARVTSALQYLCGMTVDEVAAAARRTPEEVTTLIGLPEPPLEQPGAGQPTTTAAALIAPPAPDRSAPVDGTADAPATAARLGAVSLFRRAESAPGANGEMLAPDTSPDAAPIAVPEVEHQSEAEPEPEPEPSAPAKLFATPAAASGTEAAARLGNIAPPAPAAPVDPTAAPRRRRGRSLLWVGLAVLVILGLVGGGIAWSKTRQQRITTKSNSPSGVGEPTTVRREIRSAGCDTPKGADGIDASIAALPYQGITRGYRVVAPAPATPGAARPLIIDFADLAETTATHVAGAGIDELAKTNHAIILSPTAATAFPQWNVLAAEGEPDDVGFARALIAQATATYCVDENRIVVMGQGAGAHLAAVVACAEDSQVTALVMVAGTYRPETCTRQAGLTVISILGTNDRTYPVTGGIGPEFDTVVPDRTVLQVGATYSPAAADPTLDLWASSQKCNAAANRQIERVIVRVSRCQPSGAIWRSTVAKDHEWYAETNPLIGAYLSDG